MARKRARMHLRTRNKPTGRSSAQTGGIKAADKRDALQTLCPVSETTSTKSAKASGNGACVLAGSFAAAFPKPGSEFDGRAGTTDTSLPPEMRDRPSEIRVFLVRARCVSAAAHRRSLDRPCLLARRLTPRWPSRQRTNVRRSNCGGWRGGQFPCGFLGSTLGSSKLPSGPLCPPTSNSAGEKNAPPGLSKKPSPTPATFHNPRQAELGLVPGILKSPNRY